MTGMGMSAEELLVEEINEHMSVVWPEIMREWQLSTKDIDPNERAIALVTRDCSDCGTRVRVGAIMNRLSPNRPSGERAYCAHCKCVTESPIVEVRGLVITDSSEKDE